MCAKAQNLAGRVRGGAREPNAHFSDLYVVFSAPADEGFYEAHSIRTNQIGIGETPEEALYELFASLVDLLREFRDPTARGRVCLWQKAPDEIVDKITSGDSIQIPQAIVERAIQKIRGMGAHKWTPDATDAETHADDPLHASPAFGIITEEAFEAAFA